MSMFKSEELLSRLGVTVEIAQDVAIDTLDTVNASLLTVAENKETTISVVATGLAINDMMSNGVGVGNTLVAIIAGGKALKGVDKMKKDFIKNQEKVKKMSEDKLKALQLEEDEE